jgi:hypothetical protein
VKTPSEKIGAWSVFILAVGLSTALNAITVGILYEAIFKTNTAGISSNATQILSAWGGGIIGVVAGYVGYRAGMTGVAEPLSEQPPPPPQLPPDEQTTAVLPPGAP